MPAPAPLREPDLNRPYLEMAQFYGVAIMPARPYKARDKAKVEAAVLLAERWLVAVLRHEKFFSLADLNQAITKPLERLNAFFTALASGKGFLTVPFCRHR